MAEAVQLFRGNAWLYVGSDKVQHLAGQASGDAQAFDVFRGLDELGHGTATSLERTAAPLVRTRLRGKGVYGIKRRAFRQTPVLQGKTEELSLNRTLIVTFVGCLLRKEGWQAG